MPRPIIALVTDFGLADHYVGAMKGVMLGICPDVTLVDITHDVAPHDVLGGSLQLAAAAPYFPEATVFLAVVDPGVGSARRGIAVDAGAHRFVAPDNGVLTHVLAAFPPRLVVEISEPQYVRPTISRTFEGRDRFGPAAAWLANGVATRALGAVLRDAHRLDLPAARLQGDGITGEVLLIDRFGNLVTNIDAAALGRLTDRGPVTIRIDRHDVPVLVGTYAEAAEGSLCALLGSSGHLEIACNGASAARALGLGRGAIVTVTPRA